MLQIFDLRLQRYGQGQLKRRMAWLDVLWNTMMSIKILFI